LYVVAFVIAGERVWDYAQVVFFQILECKAFFFTYCSFRQVVVITEYGFFVAIAIDPLPDKFRDQPSVKRFAFFCHFVKCGLKWLRDSYSFLCKSTIIKL
jgi:hypothetical protein